MKCKPSTDSITVNNNNKKSSPVNSSNYDSISNSVTTLKLAYFILFLITGISALMIHIELQNHEEGLIDLILLYSYGKDSQSAKIDEPVKESSGTSDALKTEKNYIKDLSGKISDDKIAEIEEQILPIKQEKILLPDEANSEKILKNKSKSSEKAAQKLLFLYNEVEKLTEDILKEDPDNNMIKELAPHLEGVLKDLNSKRTNGIEESLLHIKEILVDLKDRLDDLKKKQVLIGPSVSDSDENRVPVDEVIPDPVYFSPLGPPTIEITESTIKEETKELDEGGAKEEIQSSLISNEEDNNNKLELENVNNDSNKTSPHEPIVSEYVEEPISLGNRNEQENIKDEENIPVLEKPSSDSTENLEHKIIGNQPILDKKISNGIGNQAVQDSPIEQQVENTVKKEYIKQVKENEKQEIFMEAEEKEQILLKETHETLKQEFVESEVKEIQNQKMLERLVSAQDSKEELNKNEILNEDSIDNSKKTKNDVPIKDNDEPENIITEKQNLAAILEDKQHSKFAIKEEHILIEKIQAEILDESNNQQNFGEKEHVNLISENLSENEASASMEDFVHNQEITYSQTELSKKIEILDNEQNQNVEQQIKISIDENKILEEFSAEPVNQPQEYVKNEIKKNINKEEVPININVQDDSKTPHDVSIDQHSDGESSEEIITKHQNSPEEELIKVVKEEFPNIAEQQIESSPLVNKKQENEKSVDSDKLYIQVSESEKNKEASLDLEEDAMNDQSKKTTNSEPVEQDVHDEQIDKSKEKNPEILHTSLETKNEIEVKEADKSIINPLKTKDLPIIQEELISGEEDKSEKPLDKVDQSPHVELTDLPKGVTVLLQEIEAITPLINSDPKKAVEMFSQLSQNHQKNPTVMLSHARALKSLAENKTSNAVLDLCIAHYRLIVYLEQNEPHSVPENILRPAILEGFERMEFRGKRSGMVSLMTLVVKMFPEDVSFLNKLGYSHLLLSNDLKSADKVFQKVLAIDPDNYYAKTHLGFIYKNLNDNEQAIQYFSSVSFEEGAKAMEGRFFLHFGDGLIRIGNIKRAAEVYAAGADRGYFPSATQRSIHNMGIGSIKAQPVWTLKETTYEEFFLSLEKNWQRILSEGLKLLETAERALVDDLENLVDHGRWSQLTLIRNGKVNETNCGRAPITCALTRDFVPAASNKRGQVKFSVMFPDTHVHAHTGPTNTRLRAHLGLVVPKSGVELRVVDKLYTWTEGKIFVFDDSFEHEVWHRGDRLRLILIVDVYHPDLSEEQINEMMVI